MGQSGINIRGKFLTGESPLIMGIINVTPDSFSDVTHCLTEDSVLTLAARHIRAGADILDIGGYSTRPGADEVTPDEEWRRVQMAASCIRQAFPNVIISVDTFRASVASKAVLSCGVDIINDISGGEIDPDMFATVARLRVPYILTHTRGTPATMQSLADYTDVVAEMKWYFREKLYALAALGVRDVIIDPGFGFAKTLEHNYQVLAHLSEFKEFGLPILAGLSHKSMIYKPLGLRPSDTLSPTSALHMVCLQQGASILRVHEVKEAKQIVTLHSLLCQHSE